MSNTTAKLSFVKNNYINQHIREVILPAVANIQKTDNAPAVISHYFFV